MSLSGLTPEYLAFLKHSERLVLHPYRDPVGLPTIGYGHRIGSMDAPPLPDEAAAEKLLYQDLARYRANALALSPGIVDEPEARISAIIDFCFNAGATNYAQSTLRKRVNEKNWPAAATEMRRWVYGTDRRSGKPVKVKLPGLVTRRETTAGWLERGTYADHELRVG